MTTIEIFKSAKIINVDRIGKTITASGVDSITGTLRRRTFEYVNDATLDRAEKFLVDKTPLRIDVDSSTKNISLRSSSEENDDSGKEKPSKLVQTTR